MNHCLGLQQRLLPCLKEIYHRWDGLLRHLLFTYSLLFLVTIAQFSFHFSTLESRYSRILAEETLFDLTQLSRNSQRAQKNLSFEIITQKNQLKIILFRSFAVWNAVILKPRLDRSRVKSQLRIQGSELWALEIHDYLFFLLHLNITFRALTPATTHVKICVCLTKTETKKLLINERTVVTW